jgi:outer membrane protein assembly factor BamB
VSRLLLPIAVLFAVACPAHAENWPSWRGPRGDGHSAEAKLPVRWDAKSIEWKINLPGEGQSSPTIWGDRLFLTASTGKGDKRVVFCVDRNTGKMLWQHEPWAGSPEKSHKMNGWASATCATDGERVVAFFGKGGLHCYTVDGKHLWSRDLGAFPGAWGTAACPIIVGDLVIQNCDAEGPAAFIAGIDKHTGKTVWQTPRPGPERGGWSTPVLVEAKGHQELVLNGESAVIAYDPTSGKQLWRCKSFAGRGEPTVTPGNGLLYVVNGLQGDIYAIRPGGTGNVTKTHMAWHTPRKGGCDQPSPILTGKDLLVVNMKGGVTCYDADTGTPKWKEDRGLHGQFTAAPIAANGLAYFPNEAGETFVIQPGPKLNVVAENSIGAKDEIFRASVIPCDGKLYLRSQTHLYRIGNSR